MGKQTESGISHKIVKALNARGHFVWKNHGSVFSRRGLSDITGFRFGDGCGIALETKTPDREGELTKQQTKFIVDALKRTNNNASCGSPIDTAAAIVMVESPEWQARFGAERDRRMKRGEFGGAAEFGGDGE